MCLCIQERVSDAQQLHIKYLDSVMHFFASLFVCGTGWKNVQMPITKWLFITFNKCSVASC